MLRRRGVNWDEAVGGGVCEGAGGCVGCVIAGAGAGAESAMALRVHGQGPPFKFHCAIGDWRPNKELIFNKKQLARKSVLPPAPGWLEKTGVV